MFKDYHSICSAYGISCFVLLGTNFTLPLIYKLLYHIVEDFEFQKYFKEKVSSVSHLGTICLQVCECSATIER